MDPVQTPFGPSATLEIVSVLPCHRAAVRAVAFSPDGRLLASGGRDHAVCLWDVEDPARPIGKAVLRGHHRAVRAVAFSPDGRLLATGGRGRGRAVILWNIADPENPLRVATLPHMLTGSVWSLSFRPDGVLLATASRFGTVFLWDVSEPRRAVCVGRATDGWVNTVHVVAFGPDGTSLAKGNHDGTATLWNISGAPMPTRVATVQPHAPKTMARSAAVLTLAFSPDGRLLVTGAENAVEVSSADISTTYHWGDAVVIWDISDPARPRRTATIGEHTHDVVVAAVSPDGGLLATSGGPDEIFLWDIADPARPVRIARAEIPHRWLLRTAYSVTFSPDGRLLATANSDKTVTLWRLPASIA